MKITPLAKEKTCKACRKTKTIELFPKNKKYKNGYEARCKECIYAKQKEFRKANPNYRHEYYLANKEKNNAQSAKWFKENKEYIQQKRKKQRQTNPEAYRVYTKKYEDKSRKELTDTYIRKTLSQYSTIGRADIPQVLVEAKREQLKLLRSIKNGKDTNN